LVIIEEKIMQDKNFNTDCLAAVLFCFFLGCFGAHRFFVKKTGSAVAMLLITVLTGWIFGLGFYITGIWALVDLIMLVCEKFTTADGKVLTWTI
jgi:TM2 domain-containing membrane protein YozV